MSASYTDVANPDDISSDNASVVAAGASANNPPTATDDINSTNANSILNVTEPNGVLNSNADTDPDLDTLTVVAVNGSASGVGMGTTLASGALLTLNSDGSYSYNPNGQFDYLGLGQSETDSFEYTISDGNGGIDTAVVTITIDGVNTAPTADNDSFTTSQGTAINLTASAVTSNDSDLNGDSLTIDSVNGITIADGSSAATTSGNGTVTFNNDGTITYTPNSNFLGTDTFDYTVSDGNGGTATASITITVSPFSSSTTAGAIEGRVYQDSGNSTIGSEDSPLAGVKIDLYADTDNNGSPDGQIWATTYTDSEGKYSFTGLVPGNYVVEQTVAAGATAVTDRDGTSNNSNIQVAATVIAGETTTERDFLVNSANTASISGTVYEDSSNNNAIDPVSDTTIGGVALLLYTDPNGDGDPSDGNIIDTTLTDSNGDYSFTNLSDGNYVVVEVDPRGATSIIDSEGNTTNPEYNQIPVTLTGGANSSSNNFLDDGASTTSISGQVIDDSNANGINDTETGIDGVTVELFSDPNGDGDPSDGQLLASTTTSGGGNYSFDNLVDGNYVIVETDPNGFASTADSEGLNDNQIALTTTGTNISNQDFLDSNSSNLNSITGQVFDDNDTTNNNALDSGDVGISGVTVELYTDNNNDGVVDVGDTLIDSTVTNSDGTYQFNNLVDGNYVVAQIDPPGATSETDSQGATADNNIGVTLSGASSSNNNFLDDGVSSFAITGQVFDDNDTSNDNVIGVDDLGVAGVTVELYADNNNDGVVDAGDTLIDSTLTNSDGTYQFNNLVDGVYVLQQINPNGANSENDTQGNSLDDNIGVTLSGANSSSNNFLDDGASTTSISGQVIDDSNANGINDTETGIDGVTVELFSDPNGDGDPSDGQLLASTTTSGGGNYSFDNLVDGNYVIVETDPNGFASTADSEGLNDNQIALTTTGTNISNQDFLDSNSSNLNSITGQVFDDNDTTNNNALDSGDVGISGVTVELYTDNNNDGVVDVGDTLIDSTVTNSDGTYQFNNLVDGNYVVAQIDPPGATSETDSQGATADNNIGVTLSGASSSNNNFLDDGVSSFAITGQVFDDNDTSNDNVIGVDDLGVAGVTVELYADNNNDGVVDAGDTLIDSTLTNSDGTYQFNNLVDGVYVLQQINPNGANSENDTQGNSLDDNIGVTLSGANSSSNNFLDDGVTLGTSISEILIGTPTDNFIIGNRGQDTLTGGDGKDVFLYTKTSDSLDIITDFISGEDRLDFTQIVDEIEAFVGFSLTNPLADGYITWDNFSGVGTMVRVDFDGNTIDNLNPKDVVFLQHPNDTILNSDFIL